MRSGQDSSNLRGNTVIVEHRGIRPDIHESAYVAPNAVICGDVTVGPGCRVLFGAVIAAEGGPVKISEQCIVMENSVLRGTRRHPLFIGSRSLIGPLSYLSGCEVQDDVFLAAGVRIYNGAVIGTRSEVRINGVVHIRTELPMGTTVPIGWVAVGRPAQLFSPHDHDHIWEVQEPLDFPRTVFGLDRPPPGQTIMPELTARYGGSLYEHTSDRPVSDSDQP